METGGFSAILRYPPGWTCGAGILGVDEEMFVLDGSIEIGKARHTRDFYSYWPRGTERPGFRTEGGADVLTFFEGGNLRSGNTSDRRDGTAPVPAINIREGEWTADLESMGLVGMSASARIRCLRSDSRRGEITYITAAIPYWQESRPERHPEVAQEFFVLSGEVAGNTGTMRSGAYVWRPMNAEHGPYGSITGAVMLFRSTGGRFSTTLSDPVPFSFSPRHRPVVPKELEFAAREYLAPVERY
jgi:hypothetical protein